MDQVLATVKSTANVLKQVRTKVHINREGALSFRRSLQEQVVAVLTTGTLGNTFYASGQELAAEAMGVLLRAREECPAFLARALVYARNEGLLKTLPVLGLAVLSGGRSNRALFEAAFDRVILIPDDLRLFAALCRSGVIPGRKGLGGIASLAVKRWITRMSEYHAIKYGSAVSESMTLRDIIRMTHPRPTDKATSERLGWLANGRDGLADNAALNPQIRMLEILKRLPDLESQLVVVSNSSLPYEVVVPAMKSTNVAVWEQLMRRAPYMNLLRSLVTFTRHGVFQNEANVLNVTSRLANPELVRRSKVLPFRFFDALRAYERSDAPDSRIVNAIRDALELSFANMPTFGSRTVAIGTDVSGSMSTRTISDKSSTYCIDIAGIFTGALLRKIEGRAIPLPFEGRVVTHVSLSSRDDIMSTARKIASIGGGSTAVGSPIEYLLRRKIVADVFIGITDSEDWAYGRGLLCSGSFLELWRRYRKEVSPKCKAYLVTIAPYRDAVAPAGEPGVRYIYGWSAQVLKYISADLENGVSQVQDIESMHLTGLGDRAVPDEPEDAQTEDE